MNLRRETEAAELITWEGKGLSEDDDMECDCNADECGATDFDRGYSTGGNREGVEFAVGGD